MIVLKMSMVDENEGLGDACYMNEHTKEVNIWAVDFSSSIRS